MHVSDMTGQRRQIFHVEITSTKHPLILTMMDLIMIYPMRLKVEIYTWVQLRQVMSFYSINTIQYVPPMSARHNLQPRLPRPNQSPTTFPK